MWGRRSTRWNLSLETVVGIRNSRLLCQERKKAMAALKPLPRDTILLKPLGLPWWLRRYSVCLQYGRPRFDPRVGNILWRRKWQPTLVLLPGKSHGRRSMGVTKSRTRLSDQTKLKHLYSQFPLLWLLFLFFPIFPARQTPIHPSRPYLNVFFSGKPSQIISHSYLFPPLCFFMDTYIMLLPLQLPILFLSLLLLL